MGDETRGASHGVLTPGITVEFWERVLSADPALFFSPLSEYAQGMAPAPSQLSAQEASSSQLSCSGEFHLGCVAHSLHIC